MARDDFDDSGPADEALAAAARAGDREAFAELWRRHAGAGAVAARQFAQIADADDLLSEAYLRIFAALGRGGGPRGPFRPYLYRAIRNIALDWRRAPSTPIEDVPEVDLMLPGPELAAAERTIGFRAFRSLPQRWQSVLWYLEVEGLDPAQAAPLFGLSPNATSALAARAREGLRAAWLQAHVNAAPVPEGCRWTTARMGEYARGGLSRRGRQRFAEHLASCERCTALLDEIEDAGGRLAVLLLPLLIGGSGAAALLDARGTNADAGATGAGAPPSPGGVRGLLARSPVAAVGGAAATVLLVATVATAAALSFGSEVPPRVPGPSAPVSAPTDEPTDEPPTATPTPTPQPDPPAPPDPGMPPRVVPPPPAVPPPAPGAPAAPAAPAVDFDPATGRIAVTGTGDSPGATIEVWGTTTSVVTGVTSPPTLLASAIVAPDGTWATPEAGGLTPVNVTVVVRQVRDGLSSAAVELFADAIFEVVAESTEGTVANGAATWQLLGWPGAEWELREPAGGPTVASGTFAADGTAVATVTLPGVPSGTVVAYDYGYVQDGALAASSPGLTATAP